MNSTKQKKKELAEVDQKLAKVTAEHNRSIDTLKSAEKASDVAYNDLIDIRAKHSIGDASKNDVNEAEKAFEAAESRLNEARTAFDTQSRVVELLAKKKKDARAAYFSSVEAEIIDRVPDKVRLVFDAIETLENACEELKDFHKECMHLGYESQLGTPFTQRLNMLIPKPPALNGESRDGIPQWKKKYQTLIK